MIEATEEEQFETEIEQADIVSEKINLAVISIEEALERLAVPTKDSYQRRTEDSLSPSSGSFSYITQFHEHLESHMTPRTTITASDFSRTLTPDASLYMTYISCYAEDFCRVC